MAILQKDANQPIINVVVLGGTGMLGSMVVDVLRREPDFKVSATTRSQLLAEKFHRRAPEVEWRLLDGVSMTRKSCVDAISGAQWVINAIGITKPYAHDDNPVEVENAIRINSSLPYDLAAATKETGARVLQIATDCVYSGQRGNYSESDPHDALDVYGKTKSLGEVMHPGTNCLRCSIIGPEPKSYVFLVEWFRKQSRDTEVNGFVNHQWNGVTTFHFARLCVGAIRERIALSHLQHVIPTGTISKFELLQVFRKEFQRCDIRIKPVEAKTVVDRTLSTQSEATNLSLWAAAGYSGPPTVPEMIGELARFDYAFAERC